MNPGETPKTPTDWHNHWKTEFKAARDALEKWHVQARKIDKIIRDERDAAEDGQARWNLFCANIETKTAMLYGRPPQVSVDRRFADQKDDVGRVTGDIMTRLLNTDIERKSDGCKSAYGYALRDRLQSGWGLVRARYVVEWEDVEETPAIMGADGAETAPKVPASKRKSFEDIETDYLHWEDQLWQPSRFFHEMGWWTHRNMMTRDAMVARWPKQGPTIPLKGKDPSIREGEKRETPWDRAEVWEIWDKDHELVHWYVEDFGIIETIEDPYELDGFWPFPVPMVANLTNSKLVPRPDYVIAQDLYEEVNRISTRIKKLIEGVRISGVFDSASPEIRTMLTEAGDGDLIPVKNWLRFAQKNGIKGVVDFFPIEQAVNAIVQLRSYRLELVDMISQVTGMSDLMRGEATQAGASATEQRIKARTGSVRMQAMQDDFARFASEHQHIRAQLIAKFFEPSTILERCNCKFSTDQEHLAGALELIKSPKFSQFRIEVKPEAVSLTDFAALKQERLDALAGLGGFFNVAQGVAQAFPGAMPFLLQVGQWAISGMRGASPLEAAFDKVVQQAEQAAQAPQQEKPDPKLQAEQMKLQGAQMKGEFDMQKEQMKHQHKLQEIQAETVAHDQQEASQANWNTREAAQKALIQRATRPAESTKPGGPPK